MYLAVETVRQLHRAGKTASAQFHPGVDHKFYLELAPDPGRFGMPQMGAAGAAIGTQVSVMAIFEEFILKF